ncbi:hypothetical protein ACFLXQ_02105 [Chloroflexota bacterium]
MFDAKGDFKGKRQILHRSSITFRVLTLLVTTAVFLLGAGPANAQTGLGQITVSVCQDQNADGHCTASEESLLGAEACLNDETTCQPVPATFTDLPAGDYTPFLRFTGSTKGYYPTTPRTPINLASDESITVQLGAVYPVHPKGVTVHPALNKVYVVFQGPVVNGVKPYPFVAVIDGETDEVLRTIPGGENGSAPGAPNGMGIGREPWGVAVSGNGEFVYVSSFGDGIIAIIDPISDIVVTNISPGAPFKPTAPAVNPVTGQVHFPDYAGGRVIILNDDPETFPTGPIVGTHAISNYPITYSPFEMTIVKSLESYNLVTLRDASPPYPFKFVGFNTTGFAHNFYEILFNTPTELNVTGSPHAIGLWQNEGDESRLFITYADNARSSEETFPNPNKLLVYGFSALTPDKLSLRQMSIEVGDYAEAGLVYHSAANHMLGTYGGFAYADNEGNVAACTHSARGGTYALDREGNLLAGDAPGVWRFPQRVVGNPPYVAPDLQWRSPFEIAINPNNNKVYVTDRCWNDYPTGDQAGGSAVLIFADSVTEPTPTPTVTGTPPTETPTVTGTPPTPTVTGTPPTETPTVTGTPPTETPTVTGTPATETPIVTGTPSTGTPNVTQTPSTGTPTTTETPSTGTPAITSTPTPNTTETPATSTPNMTETPATGTPTTTETPSTGTGTPAATNTPTPNTTETPATSTPNITETPSTGTPSVTGTPATGSPTVTGTPPTVTPGVTVVITLTRTPEMGTPTVTGTPPTATPTVTGTPPTVTPGVTVVITITGTPEVGTPTVTGTPPTAMPTVTGTPPTVTPGVTVVITVTGTPSAGTPTVTPTSTRSGTNVVIIIGQVSLPGREANDWSGATVAVEPQAQAQSTGQMSATTDHTGNFALTADLPSDNATIRADAPGYLPAVCRAALTLPETTLTHTALLSGDINNDDWVDITDAVAIGLDFGATGPAVSSDINRSGNVDVLDVILLGINFGEGSQVWSCLEP